MNYQEVICKIDLIKSNYFRNFKHLVRVETSYSLESLEF